MNKKPAAEPVRKKRREPTPYHNAAFDVFAYRLRKYSENGDVELIDECQLSQGPLRIDYVIIKKNVDIELEPPWAKCFRRHNIIEYKSPVDKAPTLAEFDKLTGYAGIYASQNQVKINEMTATLVCSREPKRLFKALKEEYGYDILRKSVGIYYIIRKGVTDEKGLAIQIAIEQSDIMLAAVDQKPQNDEISEQLAQFILSECLKEHDRLNYWLKAVPLKYLNKVKERMDSMDKRRMDAWIEIMKKAGAYDRVNREGRQEGLQEGRQEVFNLLDQGYSVAEAKKMLKIPKTKKKLQAA